MRMLTVEETDYVAGGDSEFWGDIGMIGGGIFLAGALIFAAPEILAIGAITDGTLMVTGSGALVTVSSGTIAEGTAAVTAALQSAGNSVAMAGGAVSAVGVVGGSLA